MAEARALARKMLTTPTYQKSLEDRLLAGKLPPAVETMLWHYAFGKPAENLNVSMKAQDLSALSPKELLDATRETLAELEKLSQVEEELNTQLSMHPTVM
jgi:hypothetical protein